MKKILIDGTVISRKMDGVSQYIINIAIMLGMNHSENSYYTLILRKDECTDYYLKLFKKAGIILEFVDIPPIGPLREVKFWRYLKLKKNFFDVIYIPSNQYPVSLKNGIYTVHDLIYEEFPEQLGRFSGLKRHFLRWNVRQGLKRSKSVIAISNYTMMEIMKFHNLDKIENKIKVVYEGWEHLDTSSYLGSDLKKPFENYFIYVGSSRGHKNLNRLLIAFDSIKNDIDWGLLIIGNMNHLSEEDAKLVAKINSTNSKIIFTNWIDNSFLAFYYSNASAFVFPSLSEGFGIPVLEAFYYEVPLLCSNNSVFPEIAGEAAIYFDPYSIDSIASTMKEFVKNKEVLTTKLVALGKDKLSFFTWKSAALNIYNILSKQ